MVCRPKVKLTCLFEFKVSDKISSDVGFTLLEALTNEEFSDLEIIAKNRKVVRVYFPVLIRFVSLLMIFLIS